LPQSSVNVATQVVCTSAAYRPGWLVHHNHHCQLLSTVPSLPSLCDIDQLTTSIYHCFFTPSTPTQVVSTWCKRYDSWRLKAPLRHCRTHDLIIIAFCHFSSSIDCSDSSSCFIPFTYSHYHSCRQRSLSIISALPLCAVAHLRSSH